MKRVLTFSFIIIAFQVYGQDPADTTLISPTEQEEINLVDYLPPLSILIDSAIANSPNVELTENRVKGLEYEYQAMKLDWVDLIGVNARYRYNNNSRFVIDEPGVVIPREALGYQVSAGVSLPLSYLVGRKNRFRAAEMNINSAEAQRKIQETAVREEVIETYNHLLFLQKMVVLTTDAKESSDLIFEMAEDRFRDGELSVEELARSTSLKVTYSTQYEQFKADFSSTYARLERLVGMPLAKLQNIQE